jgi:hypothetical protein
MQAAQCSMRCDGAGFRMSAPVHLRSFDPAAILGKDREQSVLLCAEPGNMLKSGIFPDTYH